MIFGVGCIDQQNGVGFNNTLPNWVLPHDLRRFKHLTTGKIIVMGRKTYDSLPNKRLNNRKLHIVITKHPDEFDDVDNEVKFMTFEDWVTETQTSNEDYYVIGGAALWNHCYNMLDVFYLSYVDDTYVCDTYFDTFSWNDWIIEKREMFSNYKFFILKNKLVV